MSFLSRVMTIFSLHARINVVKPGTHSPFDRKTTGRCSALTVKEKRNIMLRIVSTRTSYALKRSCFENRQRKLSFLPSTSTHSDPGAHPASSILGVWTVSSRRSGRGVALTIHTIRHRVKPFKDEAQIALFKDPVRTA